MAALRHWIALGVLLFLGYVSLVSDDKLTRYYARHLALLLFMDALLIPVSDLILFHVYPAIGKRPPHKDTPAYRRLLANVYKLTLIIYAAGLGLYYLYSAMAQRTIYEDLGVAPSAPLDEIRKAFKGYARQHHPDKAGYDSHAVFMAIRNTYEAISQPQMRFVYDRFGPFMNHCHHCTTVTDYIYELTLFTSGPLYIITFVALLVTSLVGFSPQFLFTQWLIFFGTIAIEGVLLLCTPAPAGISNTYAESELPRPFRVLVYLRRLFPNILIFQCVSLLHNVFVIVLGAAVIAGRAWHTMHPESESFMEESQRLTIENNLLADDLLRAKLRPLRASHPDACAILQRGGSLDELSDDTRAEFVDRVLEIIAEGNMNDDERRTMRRILLGGKADGALRSAFALANESPSRRMPGTFDDDDDTLNEDEDVPREAEEPRRHATPTDGPRTRQDRRPSFPIALQASATGQQRPTTIVPMAKEEAAEFARHSKRLGPTPARQLSRSAPLKDMARRRCCSTEPDLVGWA
ncbi:hypothetical protein FB107DRAFT_254258 [Schizophyllum commune]